MQKKEENSIIFNIKTKINARGYLSQIQLDLVLRMCGSFARNVSQNLSCNGVLITARETLRHIVGQLDPTTVEESGH